MWIGIKFTSHSQKIGKHSEQLSLMLQLKLATETTPTQDPVTMH